MTDNSEYDPFKYVNKYLADTNERFGLENAEMLRNTMPLYLSLKEVKTLSIDELEKILNGESDRDGNIYPPMAAIIIQELNNRQQEINKKELINEIRKSSKVHWSTTPNFWLIVLTLLATIFGYFVGK